jgi:hypothetical protein
MKPWGKEKKLLPQFAVSGDGFIYSEFLDEFYFNSVNGTLFEYDMMYDDGKYSDFRNVWDYQKPVPLAILQMGARVE